MRSAALVTIRKASRISRALMVCSLIGLLYASANAAPPPTANEYELKAAFVYNLLPFVEWSQPVRAVPLVVGVAGGGPLGPALSKYLSGKQLQRRAIEVREVHSRAELRSCEVVIISYRDPDRVVEALSQLQGLPTLTIGDGEQFALSGGIVGFVARDNRLQLAINQHAAQRAGIRLSSKLLSMAHLVSDAANVAR